MNKTKVLLIQFQNEVYQSQIESIRAAIVNSLDKKDILFHNHLPDNGFRYSYPLIQYKRINKKSAILCLDQGTDAMAHLLADYNSNLTLNINGKVEQFELEDIRAYNFITQIWDSRFHYRIHKWMPLSQSNFDKYNQIESMAEKISFLERILCGNILSFAKGIGIYFDNKVECLITSIDEPTVSRYKGVNVLLFEAEFMSNVSIPDYAGLGKGVSIGYGITNRKKEKTINKINK